MVEIKPSISIITLNVNCQNTPIKGRDCQSGSKKHPNVCCPPEIHFKYEDTDRLKGLRKMYHANIIQRKLE